MGAFAYCISTSRKFWDNGKGFIPPKKWVDLLRQGRYGLAGTLQIKSKPGAVTLVHVPAPVA